MQSLFFFFFFFFLQILSTLDHATKAKIAQQIPQWCWDSWRQIAVQLTANFYTLKLKYQNEKKKE
jgi:hypothetical protein